MPDDIETLVFGRVATFFAIVAMYVAIYVTRRRALLDSEGSSHFIHGPSIGLRPSKNPLPYKVRKPVEDVELGLLTTTSHSEPAWTTNTISREPEEDRPMHSSDGSEFTPRDLIQIAPSSQLYQVIGEALEVFSLHLRTHRTHPSAGPG